MVKRLLQTKFTFSIHTVRLCTVRFEICSVLQVSTNRASLIELDSCITGSHHNKYISYQTPLFITPAKKTINIHSGIHRFPFSPFFRRPETELDIIWRLRDEMRRIWQLLNMKWREMDEMSLSDRFYGSNEGRDILWTDKHAPKLN